MGKKNKGLKRQTNRAKKILLPQKGEPGYKQYTQWQAAMVLENGKKKKKIIEVEYRFDNKAEEKEYRKICEIAYGCVPADVFWANNTMVYQMAKQSI